MKQVAPREKLFVTLINKLDGVFDLFTLERRMPHGALSVAGRVRFTFFLAALLLTGTFLVRDFHLRSHLKHIAQGSGDMNLAGRQRMLSQRIGLRLLELKAMPPTLGATKQITDDLASWDQAGNYLLTAVAKHDSDETPKIKPGRSFAQAEARRKELAVLARKALQTWETGDKKARAEVDDYLRALPGFMIDMEAAVKDLGDDLAADTLAQQRLGQTWSWWLLVLLAGLGGLVIEPLAWRINRDEAQRLRLNDDVARLALVAEKTFNAVIITDAARKIVWANQGFTRITGYRLDEVKGKVPGHFLQSEASDPAVVEQMRHALKHEEACRVQIQNRSKEGWDYWLDIELQPLRDAKGLLTGFIAVESDITELVNQRLKLAESEAFLERAGKVAGVGGWELDLQTNKMRWTAQTNRLHEVPSDYEPSLEKALAFYPPAVRPIIESAVETCMREGTPWDL
jgi:PAS domain S-box-containing protein